MEQVQEVQYSGTSTTVLIPSIRMTPNGQSSPEASLLLCLAASPHRTPHAPSSIVSIGMLQLPCSLESNNQKLIYSKKLE